VKKQRIMIIIRTYPNYTYDHRVILTGLHSGLCYHFRINTETEDKKVYISEDYKFETFI